MCKRTLSRLKKKCRRKGKTARPSKVELRNTSTGEADFTSPKKPTRSWRSKLIRRFSGGGLHTKPGKFRFLGAKPSSSQPTTPTLERVIHAPALKYQSVGVNATDTVAASPTGPGTHYSPVHMTLGPVQDFGNSTIGESARIHPKICVLFHLQRRMGVTSGATTTLTLLITP
jgi:hypothetical protein